VSEHGFAATPRAMRERMPAGTRRMVVDVKATRAVDRGESSIRFAMMPQLRRCLKC